MPFLQPNVIKTGNGLNMYVPLGASGAVEIVGNLDVAGDLTVGEYGYTGTRRIDIVGGETGSALELGIVGSIANPNTRIIMANDLGHQAAFVLQGSTANSGREVDALTVQMYDGTTFSYPIVVGTTGAVAIEELTVEKFNATTSLTLNSKPVSVLSVDSTNASVQAEAADPADTGLSVALVSGHVYGVSMNITITSADFVATTSPDPSVYIGLAAQNGFSRRIFKSEVDACTGGMTCTLSFMFTAGSTTTENVFAFLDDATPSAEGGFDIVGSVGYIVDYGLP